MNYRTLCLWLLLMLILVSCKDTQPENEGDIRIAFMSDVHLQNIYASFSDTDYKGVENPATGKYNTIRTMEAQLHSTRLFNENYFAFLAALEDAVQKNVKIIALPGDYTDDGQPMNVRALRQILDGYKKKHGISFLITTGNHDPVRPFGQHAGKKDFLGTEGRRQPILSRESDVKIDGLAPIITQDVMEWGYQGILNELSEFGFFPNSDYLHWETPFSTYNYANYSLLKAQESAKLENRTYAVSEHLTVPDASYLVEPQEGVWLLAIDANVYVPKKNANTNSEDPSNYQGASIGYNNVLTHKKHLIQWVSEVAKEAEKQNKTLIAFSHYPMVDFNDGTSAHKKALFGERKMQLHRVPREAVARAFANAGLKVHFAGHMHINDTGIHKTEKGHTLINVQTPSLAAYPAAYKILTIKSRNRLEVETIPLIKVPQFSELFPLYEIEHRHLSKNPGKALWNKEILQTKTYRDYVTWHLKELVRLRFVPDDWPTELKDNFLDSSGKKMLTAAVNSQEASEIQSLLEAQGLTLQDFESWTGWDMVFDFYRLHNADELALTDIGAKRVLQYKMLLKQLTSGSPTISSDLGEFATIFSKQFQGVPSDRFQIDLVSGNVQSLKED